LAVLRYAVALFDLDGTLIDSGQDLIASVRYALASVFPGREPPDGEDILVQVGKPLEVIVRELGYPTDDADVRRFVDMYRAHYAERFNEHTKPYPDVEELLEQLRAAGVKLALVTTKHQAQADFTVKALGLARHFDYVHGWLEGREHKPHPEPVLTTLGRLGVQPGEAIMVGDSELDIEAARAAGVDTCAVTYGFRPAWFLREFRPDFLVSRAPDIGPIVVADTGA
jgi:2-phosphoglycolate phosphatase